MDGNPRPQWWVLHGMNYVVMAVFVGSLAYHVRSPRRSDALLPMILVWSGCMAYFFGFFGISFIEEEEFDEPLQGVASQALELSGGVKTSLVTTRVPSVCVVAPTAGLASQIRGFRVGRVVYCDEEPRLPSGAYVAERRSKVRHVSYAEITLPGPIVFKIFRLTALDLTSALARRDLSDYVSGERREHKLVLELVNKGRDLYCTVALFGDDTKRAASLLSSDLSSLASTTLPAPPRARCG